MANGLKQKQLSDQAYQVFLKWSTQLNTLGLKLAELPQVSAMTDVTGFGVLGHLSEMLGSQFGAEIELDRIPVFDAAKQLANAYVYPNITTNNYNAIQAHTTGIDGIHMLWLCDPQTSGGLLVSSQMELNFPDLVKIGKVTAETGIRVLF
jgi:selenide,water dikinase